MLNDDFAPVPPAVFNRIRWKKVYGNSLIPFIGVVQYDTKSIEQYVLADHIKIPESTEVASQVVRMSDGNCVSYR